MDLHFHKSVEPSRVFQEGTQNKKLLCNQADALSLVWSPCAHVGDSVPVLSCVRACGRAGDAPKTVATTRGSNAVRGQELLQE